MRDVKVLNIQRMSPAETERVKAISSAIQYTNAAGWYDGEIRDTWPEFNSNRYLLPDANGEGTREERDALLAETEVVLGGWPFPLDLRARAPKLKWFHQRPAGASNLMLGDLWNSDVTVTTSRGYGNTLPIAEYAITGILHFAMGLERTFVDQAHAQFDHTGEFAGPPPERLWNHPKILITPHTSGMTDVNRHRAIEVLCENMDRYLKGEPLINVIDWEAGY